MCPSLDASLLVFESLLLRSEASKAVILPCLLCPKQPGLSKVVFRILVSPWTMTIAAQFNTREAQIVKTTSQVFISAKQQHLITPNYNNALKFH